MQRAVHEIVHEGADGPVQMGFLTAAVAVRAEQLGAAIETAPFGEMPVFELLVPGPAVDGLGKQSPFHRRAQCIAEIAHRKPPLRWDCL